MTRLRVPRDVWVAAALFTVLFLLYNADGREIGTIDSQPAKFAACELVLHHTLTLDRIVAERPGLADRPSFQRDRDGHFRNAYGLTPTLLGSAVAATLSATHLIDLRAPLAPNLVASLTASLLTALAIVLLWRMTSRFVPPMAAMLTAVGLGLGTNFWAAASRTLWGHETVAFGVALALWATVRPAGTPIRTRDIAAAGLGLALAIGAREQIAPLAGILLVGLTMRAGARSTLAWGIVSAAGLVIAWTNLHWFGTLLGGLARIEDVSLTLHATQSSLIAPWMGAAGLLVSPSRGLLVFSPFVLASAAGAAAAWRYDRAVGLRWLIAAAAVQFSGYCAYSIWWGGHTFGPRYMLDLLAPLSPLIALGIARLLRSVPGTTVTIAALAWSVTIAAAGAFIYPNDAWNTNPDEVDTHHERLWDVRDSQITRVLHSAQSPQNFNLWTREAVRPQPPR